MLSLLPLLLWWLIGLPFACLRWCLGRWGRPVVPVVHLEGYHPSHPPSWLQAAMQRRQVPIDRRTLRERLRAAGRDRRVVTVAVRIGPLAGGWAHLFELREALARARAEGLQVIAYLAHPDTRGLWVASAASKILLPPHVPVVSTGLGVEMTFLGEALDRLGVDFDVIAAGDYKSAMEPFTRTGPSEASREAIEALLDDLQRRLVTDLSTRSGRSAGEIESFFDEAPITPERVVELGLADAALAEEDLAAHLGIEPGGRARGIALAAYLGPPRPWPRPRGALGRLGRSRIGVIEIRGIIREGRLGDPPGQASARDVCQQLEAARSRNIKAVLLHIDSQGGSATASERIWRAVRRLASEKPVVAWLSDVAASGGYYIASAAHEVVAAPGTLTGSIGVIAAKPVGARLLERLGVQRVRFARGERAHLFSLSTPFSDSERDAMRGMVDRFYQLFLERVGEGRDRPAGSIDPVAGGRVWTGAQALERGLVDALGDEHEALGRLAARAQLGRPLLVPLTPPPRPSLRGMLLSALAPSALGRVEALLAVSEEEALLALCPLRWTDS